MKPPVIPFLLMLCLLLAGGFCPGPASAYDLKTATAQISIVGEYYRGDGLGQNDGLNLKKDKTFFFSQSSDDGQSAEWSGTYTFQNNHITLTPAADTLSLRATNSRTLLRCPKYEMRLSTCLEPTPSFPLKTLVAVSWGKRLYLIPDEDLRHFCNDINLGEEPRGDIHGDYFARLRNTQRMKLDVAIGKPALSTPWNTFLLATPVQAPITAVVHTGRKGKGRSGKAAGEIIALTIRAGSRQGLKPGMLLYMHGTPEFTEKYTMGDEYAVVKSVKPNECVAEFTTYVPDLPVKVGMTASTRLDKSTVEYYQHPLKPQTGGGG